MKQFASLPRMYRARIDREGEQEWKKGKYVSAKILKKKERSEYIGEIIRNKWDTRRKRTVPAPLCTLCCEISQSHRGETSFFTSPPPRLPIYSFSRGSRGRGTVRCLITGS